MLSRRDLLKHAAVVALVAGSRLEAHAAMEAAPTPLPDGLWDGLGVQALQHLVHGNRKLEQVNSLTMTEGDYYAGMPDEKLRPMADYRRLMARREAVLAELKQRGVLHVLREGHILHWQVDSRNKACRPWEPAIVGTHPHTRLAIA